MWVFNGPPDGEWANSLKCQTIPLKMLWYTKNWKYMCDTVTALNSWGLPLNSTRGTDVTSEICYNNRALAPLRGCFVSLSMFVCFLSAWWEKPVVELVSQTVVRLVVIAQYLIFFYICNYLNLKICMSCSRVLDAVCHVNFVPPFHRLNILYFHCLAWALDLILKKCYVKVCICWCNYKHCDVNVHIISYFMWWTGAVCL